jgi:hypothetical protein
MQEAAMSSMLVFLGYGFSLVLAVVLLRFFHACTWYWHVLSLALAVGLGLMPAQAAWQGPAYDLTVGMLFVFLLVWGIGGLLMFQTHHEKHA